MGKTKKEKPRSKRRGRVKLPRSKANGKANVAPEDCELQIGTSPGVVRVQFKQPVEKINFSVAQAFEFAQALMKGASSAQMKLQKKLAGLTPRVAAPKPEGEAPEVLGPDGEPAPRPARVSVREPKE